MSRNLKIAVLGAGIVGTCTAIQLQHEFANSDICMIDEYFDDHTLSYHPAGIFRVGANFGGMPYDRVKECVGYSYDFYDSIRTSEASAGIYTLDGFILSNESKDYTKNKLMEEILPKYRDATADEMASFKNPWKYGSYFETLRIECSSFIPWSLKKFNSKGNFKKCKIQNFSELKDNFDVVFNCAGYSAKYLCDDHHLIPIQGHIITVNAPCVKKCYYSDIDSFIIPIGAGYAALGTNRNFECHDQEVDEFIAASILKRCSQLVPCVSKANIIKKWVGLRPYRHVLRLEIEKSAKLIIAHNYGHGGYGITTAPGTSRYLVNEFKKFHSYNSKL